MNKKRCLVLFDGSNFYFKLKDLKLHHLLHFSFSTFAQDLCRNDNLIGAVYYVGKVRTDGTKKTLELHSKQRQLLAHLTQHSVRYELGYLLKSGGKMHEKGVDVNIATDLLVAAYENTADHIIVISSDTDLIPAIKKAREQGKTVEYIGFKHMASKAMMRNCSTHRLFTREQLKQYIMPSPSRKNKKDRINQPASVELQKAE